ncbi:hypothetical protein [Piscinibacter koreensis]|uniref:Uncharacterized protein n=1 Tax=Piscinibacter koreensis TaxID=2742824 RepID=A0A7Y6NPX0_9BURK|nr:hypothetical protein [Schlegelella koreensis]NUZ07180.1 hypothetical protein [Schlegelella koreensis]
MTPAARLLLRRAAAWRALLLGMAVLMLVGAVVMGARPRPWWFALGAVVLVGAGALTAWVRWQRERVIRERTLPAFLKRKLREQHPHLDGADCDLVERGFRQFFLACARSDRAFVAMPSRAVDTFWHAFILHTRAYAEWCDLALGRFLHHTPAEALGARASDNDGLRRAWYWSCKDESIDPRKPSRLPLLFALDRKLAIAGGFVYVTDCRDILAKSAAGGSDGAVYCGTSFGDDGFSGDADSFGGAESSDGGGGDGDGGSGCGGD